MDGMEWQCKEDAQAGRLDDFQDEDDLEKEDDGIANQTRGI